MKLSSPLGSFVRNVLIILALAGCAVPGSAPSPAPTPTLPLQVDAPLPPESTEALPPIRPSPTTAVSPVVRRSLLKFVQTVQVTPDSDHLTGGFTRIGYLPASDRFAVTFGGELAQPSGGCQEKAYSYKIYTTDMQDTGESGVFSCDPVDAGALFVGDTYYFAAMAREGESVGWHLLSIDTTSWTTLTEQFHALNYPQEGDGDPMVAFVNGQVDISSAYNQSGEPVYPETPPGTYGTHHHLFSPDLQCQEARILTAPPHIGGSSMIWVDETYYLVTANIYDGDVLVAAYDGDWNYRGGKTLIRQAHFSTGLVYDGERFYLAYTDTSQRTEPGFFPVFLNIHLAVFDREWNLVDDVAVTDYAVADNMQPGRPWVMLHGNRLYVSYDLDMRDPSTGKEQMRGQALVSVYELAEQTAQSPTSVSAPSAGQRDVFRLIKTVQVTPDHNFREGSSGYIHYVEATGRFVVILVTHLSEPVSLVSAPEECQERAIGYKEYDADLDETGKHEFIACGFADVTSRMIGNELYVALMAPPDEPGATGTESEYWRLQKFDAVGWKRLASVDFPLDPGFEGGDGPTVSFINGQIDVTGQYFVDKDPFHPLGRGSHHHFFTTDLVPLGKRILKPPEYPRHYPEVSMMQETGGDILMFVATAPEGDIVVLRFDKDWSLKEEKKLREKAFFPTGSAKDGKRFYIAYTDTSKSEPGRLNRNVRLAAFDAAWNLLQDVAVTDFVNKPDTWVDGESPWVQLVGNHLYVSYVVTTLDIKSGFPVSYEAYVDLYELIAEP